MEYLWYQVSEFFRPFPEKGSWSYNVHAWWYDITIHFK